MSSSSMSTGVKYFIDKYDLAHDVAKPHSKACEWEVKAVEELMAAPYKTFRATKTAGKELKGLSNVTEKDVVFFEEFLEERREELKNKEEEEKQTSGNGAHDCKARQSKPRLILTFKNSTLRRSQSTECGSTTETVSSASGSSKTEAYNDYKSKKKPSKRKTEGYNDCKAQETPSKKPRLTLTYKNSTLRRSQSADSGTGPASSASDSSKTEVYNDCKAKEPPTKKPRLILNYPNSPLRRSRSTESGSGSSSSGSIKTEAYEDCKAKETPSKKPRLILNFSKSPLRRSRSAKSRSTSKTASPTSGSTSKNGANDCKDKQTFKKLRIILNVPDSPLRRSRSSESGSTIETASLASGSSNKTSAKDCKCKQKSKTPRKVPLRRTKSTRKTAASPATEARTTTNNGKTKSPNPRIKLRVPNPTLRRSQTPKFEGPRQSPLRIRLRVSGLSTQAWEKVFESVEETPAPTPAPTQQQQKQNTRKRKNEGLFDLESATKRPHSELCKPAPVHEISKPFIADNYKYVNDKPTSIWDGTTIHEDLSTKQMVTRGMARRSAAKRRELEGGRKKVLQPPKKDDPLRFGTSEFIKDQEIADDLKAIKARKEEQAKFRDLQEKLKAMARHYNSEEAPNHQVYNKMKEEQAKKRAEEEANQLGGHQAKKIFGQVKAEDEQEVELAHQEPAQDAFEADDHMILDKPMDLGIFTTEKKAMKAYKEAEKCAHLAKQTVEAKQKLVAIARELETVDKKIGPNPNRSQLSAIPAHIRMLMVPSKTKAGRPVIEFAIRTNGDFPNKYTNTIPRKPSKLRHELGASLAEKEAAEVAKQKAEEEEKQRRELQAEQTRIRQQNAQRNMDKFLETRAMPDRSDEDVLNDFQQALNLWLESDEGKRQREGEEYAERMARGQGAVESQAHFGGVAMQRVPTDKGYSSMRSAPVREEEDKMDGVEIAASNDYPAMRRP
ncbi:hypothetical protein NA56DRAFT_711946 [Hyaloscypha hepaticicola]|uniref:Uncharacterized protein n=1 Tax=Hyaloscypha hepaticicola TaxID=2082293 RepID=A0A2J6PHN7_9HELO|nr:hypothetical protein NA56DRAFT_711946 [Hyaloscypha hepaticicola]